MAPLEGIDVTYFPLEKISIDVSGPYGDTSRDKNWLTNWPEAFAVPDKSAKTVADLISETFPRYGAPVQLVTDNRSDNVNNIKDDLISLNVVHITTSPYHPKVTLRWRDPTKP